MIILWLRGLLRRRPGRLIGATAGIAVAVALLASLGAFLAHSQATMTDRAVRGVGIDWQVQVQSGADPAAVTQLATDTTGVTGSAEVGFGTSAGLTTTNAGSTQTTGTAVVLGVPADYRTLFPTEIRTLAGADVGVLLAQQTAANLHAAPGDVISVAREGLAPVTVTVAGIVDLPLADSLFQKIGAPVGSQLSAPPDNVLLLPTDLWHQTFDPLAATRPDLVSTQIHLRVDHRLPTDPASAYTAVTSAAHHFEAGAAGGAVVGDNLGAALDAARADAAYAQVLFGFLGVPGAVLAALLTSTITAAGATRRRGEQALLRARGASATQLIRLAGAEAALTGIIGSGIGLALAAVVGRVAFGTARFGATTGAALAWAGASAAAGLLIAGGTILLPARRDLRSATVAAGRSTLARVRYPSWARYGLDGALLIAAGLIWTASTSGGYQLVLAPEGVPTIAVSYWALAGPALLWIGAGLLTWRLVDLLLGRGAGVVSGALRPVVGGLATPIAAGLGRQRRPLTRAIVLLGLALAFAVSTATFNSTYAQQAEADAQLTNGADVTVTVAPAKAAPTSRITEIAAVPGVLAVEPLQHRFAYIGTDLQDLYGVRPATITTATALQDTYFSGGTAAGLMTTLAAQRDSILVSAETVKDYQLTVGDSLNLRLVDGRTNQLITVPFHYVGVVSEFPTAPKDSFFVANADYIAQQTGNAAAGAFLVDTGGRHTTEVADRIRALLGPTATVTDISTTRQTIGSSLTAVDLTGLTRVELSFALVLAVAAGGLVLGLGLAERRRTFAIATALGASRRQLRGMISSEGLVLAVGGLVAGTAIGTVLSIMLVKVLTGVFDPPPSSIAVPWIYLGVVGAATVLGLLVVVMVTTARTATRPAVAVLREL
ncbi:MAG: FtsX-like permease family protein [Nakamurella sp.]